MGSIAIVGCGAAGTALIVQLAERQWEGIDRVLIIDPRLPASGIAFDRDEEYLLCNTSVGVNSLIPREPDHLRKWLMRNPVCTARWGVPSTGITEHSYLPRGLFLAFLAEHFRSALAHAQSRGGGVRRPRAGVSARDRIDWLWSRCRHSQRRNLSGRRGRDLHRTPPVRADTSTAEDGARTVVGCLRDSPSRRRTRQSQTRARTRNAPKRHRRSSDGS